MSKTHADLEQLLVEKNVLKSKINEYKLHKTIIFEQKGIEVILKKGKQLVQKGFTAQQANEVLQKICREVCEELSKIDLEIEILEKQLSIIDKSSESL